jgi:drug/metabolite transporter (DMT)-like permease
VPLPRARTADWLSLLALVLIWGTGFAAIRVAVASIAPLGVAAGRITLAALVLGALVLARRSALPREPRRWVGFLAVAVLGNALPFFLISWGQQSIPSGLAGIWMATNPMLTGLLAHFFAGEPLTRPRLAAIAVGFAGVCALLGPGLSGALQSDLPQQGALFAAACCYSAAAVLSHRLPPCDPLVSSTCVLALASALIAPAALALELSDSRLPTAASLAALLWLGLVPTGLGLVVFFRLIRSAGPGFFSLAYFPIPAVAVASGALLFGERLGLHALLGMLLIASSLALPALLRAPAAAPREPLAAQPTPEPPLSQAALGRSERSAPP